MNVSVPAPDIVWWSDQVLDGPLIRAMTSISDEFERGARVIVNTVLAPWGGTQLCIDAYEASVRTASDLHMNVARTVSLEPVRSVAATFAGVTRDIGAAQVSLARWFLDA
jgi:hypothetical protein